MCDVEAVFGLSDGVEHWVTSVMPELSPSVRPTRFGRDEKPKKGEVWSLTDRQRFEEFRAENNSGYFLYGKGHEYHVQPHDNPPTVFFSCRAEKLAIAFANEILDSLANHGAVCGRGTSREEYQARNGYVMHFVDGGQVSGLLGRDFRRYVPGLYWLNYVSDQYRRTMPVPWEAIAERTGGDLRKTSNGVVLQLCAKPTDWQEKDEVVRSVLRDTENIFSKEAVEIPVDVKMLDFIHGSELAFTKNWP